MMTFRGVHDAVQRDDSEAVKAFLEDGVDINSRDEEYGWTPLKLAAYSRRMKAAQLLFERGVQNIIHQKEFDEALVFAARSHSAEFVRLFLENGKHLLTPEILTYAINIAAFQGFYETLLPLVEHGAKVTDQCFVDAAGGNVFSDQSHAERQVRIIEFLLAQGTDINAKDRQKDTALIRSVRAGNLPAVRFFISRGVRLNIKNSLGKTALKVAVETCHTEIANVLVEAGAKL